MPSETELFYNHTLEKKESMEISNKKECGRNTILSHELENMWQNLYPLDCDHLWKFIGIKLDARWFFCLQNLTET